MFRLGHAKDLLPPALETGGRQSAGADAAVPQIQ